MNRKQAEQVIKNFELVKAFANGATIQCTERFVEPKCWEDTRSPVWDDDFEYRVKPEPEELFITVQGDRLCEALFNGCDLRYDCFMGGTYPNLDMAANHTNDWKPHGKPASRIFKVVEVMP